MEFSKEARQLIKSQINDWDLASANYKGLENVKTRSIAYVGFDIQVQFNPKRITSSAAKVDAKSIEARPCFLCQKNLPAQQRGLPFRKDYMVLVNPFPIFPEHLTIPHLNHVDQRIKGNFEDMLDLAEALSDFVVFYNGPRCGASAPDHLHFQAGIKGFLPIEKDFHKCGLFNFSRKMDDVNLYEWKNNIRNVITFQSNNKQQIASLFKKLYLFIEKRQSSQDEPMLNILALFENGTWIVHLFLRKLHRPSQYFETGEKQIVLSPASVDLGGVFITPREEDFIKITSEDISDILKQVCSNDATFHDFMKAIVN